jgi:hypothetical protein
MLDCGVIRDLKFSTYTFENNSQGKFMLSIMFGQSKYYSDALSENVKRGNRTKLENGWRPSRAPLGYLNDAVTRTIIPDPDRFPFVRQVFELILTGAASPRQITLMARDEWGFRTPKKRRRGGTPLVLSTIYKMLANPFYAGDILWGGRVYPGKHQAVVTHDEFARVQKLLKRDGQAQPSKHTFAFTGIIRCGSCGGMVTAEHKVNPYGSRYIYYHCARKGLGVRCPEPSIEVKSLEAQIASFLGTLFVDPQLEAWAIDELANETAATKELEASRIKSVSAAIDAIEKQLRELTGIRLRSLIDDEEFQGERRRLETEQACLKDRLAEHVSGNPIELFGDLVSFSKQAVEWFLQAESDGKRLIVKTALSNLVLTGKNLSIEAVKPFVALQVPAPILQMCGVVEAVHTSGGDSCGTHIRTTGKMTGACPENMKSLVREYLQGVTTVLADPAYGRVQANIARLRRMFDPLALPEAENGLVVKDKELSDRK